MHIIIAMQPSYPDLHIYVATCAVRKKAMHIVKAGRQKSYYVL